MSETHAYRRARSVGSDEAPTLVCADAAGSQDQRDANQMCRSWLRTDDVHPRQDDSWLQDNFTISGKMSGRNQTAKAGEADAPKSVTPREQGGLMPFWSFPGRQSLINSRCAGRLGRTIVLAALTFCSASVPHAQPTT